MHPNDALDYIASNESPEWAIINFPDEAAPNQECWKLFLSSASDSKWHQVLECHPPFIQLDWVIKAMYENGLPVSTMPIAINDWD